VVNSRLLRWMPASMRSRLAGRAHLQQILTNTGWLFGDRILRMGTGLIVGVWVARYLGPGDFGLFNYAQAIVAIFTAVATLGLDRIVVRDLVHHPGQRQSILGTTLALRLAGALAALVVQELTVFVLRPEDRLLPVLVAILGSGMVFQAFDSVDLWYQSQVQSKYSVIAKNVAFLMVAGLKVSLVLTRAPLLSFAWAALAEAALGALLLLIIYRRHAGGLGSWRFEIGWAKALIRDGWPMVLSGFAVMIYMRIDQIMLGQMRGNHDVGVYSAALRFSEIWYFIPMAIVSSVAPSITAAKQLDEAVYYGRIQKLLRVMVLVSLSIIIPVSFLASYVVVGLYGDSYAAAGPILAIHIWGAVFVFMGVAQGPWFVTEGLMKAYLNRALAGGIVNVLLNLYLIPRFGGLGAAVATLVAQVVSTFLMNALDPRTRRIFWMEARALNILKVVE
jgi:PST family polysaccharide transporter